jgi:glycosyltransferase involved in cell wall biosynthesis
VVGADGGGVPELLENGRCGELFRMGDSLQLASAIERLLLQTQHRRELVTKARERALQIFRSDRVAREVSEIWSLVLNKSPGRPHSRPWIEDPGSFQLPTAWRRLVG